MHDARSVILLGCISLLALFAGKVVVDRGTAVLDTSGQVAPDVKTCENRGKNCSLSAYRSIAAVPQNSVYFHRNNSCSRSVSHVAPSNRVLIHIGKCGGATIKTLLQYRFQVHVHKKRNSMPVEEYRHPKTNDHLIVTVRDPIDRLISAWYWDVYYFNEVKKKPLWRCLKCPVGSCVSVYYSSFEAFAEDLDKNSDARAMWINGCIEHFKQGYAHYINGIRHWMETHPCQVHVLRQEYLKNDVRTVLGVELKDTRIHSSRHSGVKRETKRQLSKRARENLGRLLVQEYDIYHWLLQLNDLSP
eukprot:gb/GECG01004791.1/.p1 GENE.gb/GECG01004791.1/~~gb/GECG01004791.1/.p1  ORF type:complete len:302 (+),score=21.33 gb/GECG01004791.1/:1-906(+)